MYYFCQGVDFYKSLYILKKLSHLSPHLTIASILFCIHSKSASSIALSYALVSSANILLTHWMTSGRSFIKYSGSSIQRQFLDFPKIGVVAKLMLYWGLIFADLKMMLRVYIPSLCQKLLAWIVYMYLIDSFNKGRYNKVHRNKK